MITTSCNTNLFQIFFFTNFWNFPSSPVEQHVTLLDPRLHLLICGEQQDTVVCQPVFYKPAIKCLDSSISLREADIKLLELSSLDSLLIRMITKHKII